MGSPRNNRRKYAKSTNDHVIFILVILLAAALYTNHIVKQQGILILVYIVLILLMLLVLGIQLRRSYTRHRTGRHFPHAMIDTMSGVEFERYVVRLLPGQGFSHIHLTEHYDLGVDIIAEKEGALWGIQVKRYSAPVKLTAIREVVTALQHYGCNRAMVITNSTFSPSAQDLALSNNCVLIDGQQLIYWATHSLPY